MHICYQGRIQVLWGLKLKQFLGPSVRKGIQNLTTKLGMKVNIYLGPLPGPWKGPVQVRGPEAHGKSSPVCYIGVLVLTF